MANQKESKPASDKQEDKSKDVAKPDQKEQELVINENAINIPPNYTNQVPRFYSIQCLYCGDFCCVTLDIV